MELNSNVRRKTLNIVKPEGTAAGTHEVSFVSDSDMRVITGVTVYNNSLGGASSYKLGIKSDPGGAVIQDPTNMKDWIGETSVCINERYKKLGNNGQGIQAQAQKYVITIVIPTLLNDGNLDIDVVFHQEK